MDKHRGHGGFTLMELLLTLGLVVMLAGISLGPALSGRLQDRRLDSFVQGFTNDLRQVRHVAITEATPYEIRMRKQTGTGNMYYEIRRSAHPIWENVKYVFLPEGISISTAHNDQNVEFIFGTSGFLQYVHNNTIHFQNGRGTVRKVVVSQGGRIRIE